MYSNHVLPCLLQLERLYTFTNEACASAWLNCITKLQSLLVFGDKCPVSVRQNSYKIFPVYVRVNHCEYNASRYTLPQICCMLLSLIGHFLITALQYYPFCLTRKKKTHKYSSTALIVKELQSLLLRKQQKMYL